MKIGIIMGSNSDYGVMKEATTILDEFDIKYDLQVVSAHRTPDMMYEYAKKAEENDIAIIIAGAGGAAHLPGMVASLTTVPVIGIPIKSRSLEGLDSLLSIVQMPKGVPVATMGINQAANGALFALEILGITNIKIKKALLEYKISLENKVKEMELV